MHFAHTAIAAASLLLASAAVYGTPWYPAKTYYFNDKCGNMSEIEVDRVVNVKLARLGSEVPAVCRSQITLKPMGNFTLLVTIAKLHLIDENLKCREHFILINGLEDDARPRYCNPAPPNATQELVLQMADGTDRNLYYFRSSPLQDEEELEIVVSPAIYAIPGQDISHTPIGKAFRCSSTHLLIPEELRCDSVANCADGSDEIGCAGTTDESTTTATTTTGSASENSGRQGAGDKSNKTPVIVGVTGGVIIILVVAVVVLFLVRRNMQRGFHSAVSTIEEPRPQTVDPAAENLSPVRGAPKEEAV